MFHILKSPALFLLGISMVTAPHVARADEQFTKGQKQEINQMIRDYILENPEILPEAIRILQSRGQKAQLEQNYSQLHADGFSYVGGNPDGDVTVIEFFDYNCGYCKKSLSSVERLKADDKNLRVIYKELPVLAETSFVASKAAMAAMKQEKYQPFHIALMKNPGGLTEERIFEIAREVGLDEDRLAEDMTSPVLDRNLQINHRLAEVLDISGTPAYIIGDRVIAGAVPYENLVELISATRRQQAAHKTE